MNLKKLLMMLAIPSTILISSCPRPPEKTENVVRKIDESLYIQKLTYDWSKLDRNELIIAGYHNHPFGEKEKPILILSYRDKSNKFIMYLDRDNDGSVDRYATGQTVNYPNPEKFFDREQSEHQFKQYDFELAQYKKKLNVDKIINSWEEYKTNSKDKTGEELKKLRSELEKKINEFLKGNINTIALF